MGLHHILTEVTASVMFKNKLEIHEKSLPGDETDSSGYIPV